MVIFNRYVKLPEGSCSYLSIVSWKIQNERRKLHELMNMSDFELPIYCARGYTGGMTVRNSTLDSRHKMGYIVLICEATIMCSDEVAIVVCRYGTIRLKKNHNLLMD